MNLTSFLLVTRASFLLAVKTEMDSLSNSGFRFRWHSRLLNYLRKKKKRRAGRKWNRDQSDRQLRLAYDLGPECVVLDCGAYLGNFAAEIVDRYQCEVFCFEPVSGYFAQLSKRFADRPRVARSEEHTSELQSRLHLVCRLLLEKKKKNYVTISEIVKIANEILDRENRNIMKASLNMAYHLHVTIAESRSITIVMVHACYTFSSS